MSDLSLCVLYHKNYYHFKRTFLVITITDLVVYFRKIFLICLLYAWTTFYFKHLFHSFKALNFSVRSVLLCDELVLQIYPQFQQTVSITKIRNQMHQKQIKKAVVTERIHLVNQPEMFLPRKRTDKRSHSLTDQAI